jgi:hypothetical protein
MVLLGGCDQNSRSVPSESGGKSAPLDAGLPPGKTPRRSSEPAGNQVAPVIGAGLCSAGEEVIFSCQLDNSKFASICGTRNNIGKIVAQYRYGEARQKPELTWPDANSGDRLKFASVPYSGGGEAQLHFRRGDNQYIVYSRVIRTNFTAGEPNEPTMQDGVFVRKGEKVVARHACVDPHLVPIDYEKAELHAEKLDDGIVDLDY